MIIDVLDRLWENIQIKFHENPSSGSRVVPCGQTDGRDVKKPIVYKVFH
jgi:hypothetical protein